MSPDEFNQSLGILGLLDNDYLSRRLFGAFDTTHTGYLSAKEWVLGVGVMLRGSDADKIDLSFRIADSQGGKCITEDQFLDFVQACQHMREAFGEDRNQMHGVTEINLLFSKLAKSRRVRDVSSGDWTLLRSHTIKGSEPMNENSQQVISLEDYTQAVKMEPDFLELLGLGKRKPNIEVLPGVRRDHLQKVKTHLLDLQAAIVANSPPTPAVNTEIENAHSNPSLVEHAEAGHHPAYETSKLLPPPAMGAKPSGASGSNSPLPPKSPGPPSVGKSSPSPTPSHREQRSPERLSPEQMVAVTARIDKLVNDLQAIELEASVGDAHREADAALGLTDVMVELGWDDPERQFSFTNLQHYQHQANRGSSAGSSSQAPDALDLGRNFSETWDPESFPLHSNSVTQVVKEPSPPRHIPKSRDRSFHILGPRKGLAVHFGHENWNMVLNMMMGVRMAVGRAMQEPSRAVQESDFLMKEKFSILPRMSNIFDISATKNIDVMRFIDYSPMVFRQIRANFGINHDDYLRSVGPCQLLGNMMLGNLSSLSELSSEGKSGAFFYYTADGKFMMKTVTRAEWKTLRSMLRSYYDHVKEQPGTFLMRIFGLHSIRVKRNTGCRMPRFGPNRHNDKTYFVVFGNVFYAPVPINRRYDLKGSWVGRSTSPDVIGKDLSIALKDNDIRSRGSRKFRY